jgi:hypothetical protein
VTIRLEAALPADRDGDGVPDPIDNCPALANPDQADGDANGAGDLCEGDGAGDGATDGGAPDAAPDGPPGSDAAPAETPGDDARPEAGGDSAAPASELAITPSDYRPDVDLTVEGTLDWAHFGTVDLSSFDHKASGGRKISNATGGVYRYQGGPTYTWSDGVPTASASTASGIYSNGVAASYSLTVEATTALRTLRLYIGADNNSIPKLTAHLSDGSAPDAVLLFSPPPANMTMDITFRAASDRQQLIVTWVNTVTIGSLSLGSATLF